jgi:hypothetical protein
LRDYSSAIACATAKSDRHIANFAEFFAISFAGTGGNRYSSFHSGSLAGFCKGMM